MGDQCVGGIEDQLSRAVVLLELDHCRIRVVTFEVEDVAYVGAPPGIDRLVVIADNAQVVVARSQGLDPQVLRSVGVLVFVDVQIAPPSLVALQDGGRVLEEPNRLEQQIVEVERGGCLQARLVAPVESGDLPLPMSVGVGRDEVRIEHLVLRPRYGAQDRARLVLARDRQVFLSQDLLHQGPLVVGVVDDEVGSEADCNTFTAQHPSAEGVKGAHRHLAAGFLSHQPDDAGAQLGCRLVGERDGEDLPRPNALDADQVGDSMSQHARLAAARAGQN